MEAAVADLHTVYASTARERGQMKAVVTPERRDGRGRSGRAASGAGFCSGPSAPASTMTKWRSPMSIITFPVQPRLRLAQSRAGGALCGYEWFKAAHGDAPPPSTIPRANSPPAQREMLLAFFDYLEAKLDENGFFRPVTKKPGMRRNLRNIFHRMELTQQDVRTLWGAVVRLVEGPRVEVQTRKRVRPKKPGG